MPEEYHVTIRLTPEIYTQLEARGSQGQPLAAIVRHALVEYLARQPEAPASAEELALAAAAVAARLDGLQAQVEALAARVETLGVSGQPLADESRQPPPPAAARIPATPSRTVGRPRSAVGQQILATLAQHPEGLTAEQLRATLTPSKPIGDTLAGMKRLGTVRTTGQGRALRYFLPSSSSPAPR